MQVLQGIRVIDLTRLLPGPYCTMMMADYGAEVIKVEHPEGGDYGRRTEPLTKGYSTRFLTLNRNKQSLTLNLKTDEGKQRLKKLCEDADVLVESFRPGVMQKLDLGYNDLKKINPRLIYCSITGYGQDGPYSQYAGHDLNYLAISGILGLTGKENEAPIVPGVQVADIGGGSLMALSGILMALLSRRESGEGRFVDVSMFDGALSLLAPVAHEYLARGSSPERGRTRLTGKKACYGVYETKDGKYIAIAALEKKFWRNVCDKLGKATWVEQLDAVDELQEEMKQELQHILLARTQAEWLDILGGEETCVSPVNDLAEVFCDPHVQARNMLIETEHPVLGKIMQVGFPIKFSGDSGEVRSNAPELGDML